MECNDCWIERAWAWGAGIRIFYELLTEGFKPNEVTFVIVLSACSRAGLLEEGRQMFDQMVHTHGIKPTIDHYGCIVDLLGHFGLLEEAEELAKKIPCKEAQVVWESLLGAYRSYGDVERAECVARMLLDLDPLDTSGYVQLSNVKALLGRFNEAVEVRMMMKVQGVRKDPGCSMIKLMVLFMSSSLVKQWCAKRILKACSGICLG